MGLKTMVESSRPRRRSFRKWPSYMTDRWGSHVLTRSPSSVPPTPTEWLATFPIYGLRIRQLERWDNQVLTSSPFSLPSTGGASLDSWSFALPDEPCKVKKVVKSCKTRSVCFHIWPSCTTDRQESQVLTSTRFSLPSTWWPSLALLRSWSLTLADKPCKVKRVGELMHATQCEFAYMAFVYDI